MVHSVRDLDQDDVQALQELIESFPIYAEKITGYPPGPSDALSALIAVPPGFNPESKRSIGLWDGDELVAFADVLLSYPDPETAYIGLLIVHGSRHGEGLGSELHEAVLKRIRQETAAQQVRLGIVETMADTAKPFWSALGYAPTGETKPYRYDKLSSTVTIWERPLQPAAAELL